MNAYYQTFKALHEQDRLFLLPNAWDVASAHIFRDKGYPAIATSSAAVAQSLGYEDGEAMPFTEYLYIIKRMAETVALPLTVDMEMGYGSNGDEIYAHVAKLAALGVAGINLEDSIITPTGRVLQDAGAFAVKLGRLRELLDAAGTSLFINVRCDTFFLGSAAAVAASLERAQLYQAAGATGLFLPGLSQLKDIQAVAAATSLPLNIMALPGLPALSALHAAGVRRLSTGPFLFNYAIRALGNVAAGLQQSADISGLFATV